MTARIAYVVEASAMGGVETHLLTLLRHLPRPAYDVAVVLPPPGASLPLGPAIDALDIPVYYQPLLQRFNVAAFRRIVERFRRIRPDVVHVHLTWTFDNRWMFLAARVARCPVVLSTEHLSTQAWIYGSPRIRAMKRVVVALQDRVLVPCDHVGANLVRLAGIPPSKLTTIHYGVEVPERSPTPNLRAELALPPDAYLIGMVARLDPSNKAYEVFLHAAAQVHRRYPRVHFLIVGDGPPSYRASLEALTGRLGLSCCVRFLGFREDAPVVAGSLNLLVLASKNEACVPLSILEGMVRGVPVVVTDVGGVREQMSDGDTGTLVSPGDPGALAHAMCSVLDDPAAASHMAETARVEAMQRFSVSAMVGSLDALYAELIGQRQGVRPASTSAGHD